MASSNSNLSPIKEENRLKTESHDSSTDESSSITLSGLQDEVISTVTSLVALQVPDPDPAGVHSRPSSIALMSFLRKVKDDLTTMTKASEGLTDDESCSIRLLDSVLKLIIVKCFESKQGLQPHLITEPPVNEFTEQRLDALPISIKPEPQRVTRVATGTINEERPIQQSEHMSEFLPTSIKKSPSEVGYFRCSCMTCQNQVQKTKSFTQYRPHKATHAIEGQFNCKSKDVVFLLECGKCPGAQYVGHTTRPLRKEINNHRSKIKSRNSKTKVHRHFYKDSHNVSDLQVTVICKGSKDQRNYWIEELHTFDNDNELCLNMKKGNGFSDEEKSKATTV